MVRHYKVKETCFSLLLLLPPVQSSGRTAVRRRSRPCPAAGTPPTGCSTPASSCTPRAGGKRGKFKHKCNQITLTIHCKEVLYSIVSGVLKKVVGLPVVFNCFPRESKSSLIVLTCSFLGHLVKIAKFVSFPNSKIKHQLHLSISSFGVPPL